MTDRVRALREAFDLSFAVAPRAGRERSSIALGLRIGDDPYALPLAPQVAMLTKAPRIVVLPGGTEHQLGVAGVRGRLAVVFSLPGLLGYARSTDVAWLAILSGARDVALAFDRIDGQIDLHEVSVATTTGGRRHIAGVVGTAPPRALIDIPSILERL